MTIAVQPAPRRGIAGWLLFDWATQPFYTLVATLMFAPYFTAQIAADPVAGQAAWGYGATVAGLVIAVLSPIMGAIADAGGRRKPWIVGFSVLLFGGSALLWFVEPGSPVIVALALAAIATIGVEFATVFNNAMMGDLVPENRVGRLSGSGWSLGYVGGMVSVVLALGFVVIDAGTGKTLIGLDPIFGLDPARFEDARASGPISAIWFAVFVLPFFLWTPDTPRRMGTRAAVRAGLSRLAATLRGIRSYGNITRYLIAHMIYADGIAAMFAFGGIYAASIFEWNGIELGIYGVLLTVAGAIGAFIGGVFDDRIGAKRVILIAIAILVVGTILALSVDEDSIAFVFTVDPRIDGDAMFGSAGERLYLLVGILLGIASGPIQASSRSLLSRLIPPERATEFFGLHALSGKATSFIATFAVAGATSLAGDQRIGLSVVVVFFVVGGLLLLRVREERTELPV